MFHKCMCIYRCTILNYVVLVLQKNLCLTRIPGQVISSVTDSRDLSWLLIHVTSPINAWVNKVKNDQMCKYTISQTTGRFSELSKVFLGREAIVQYSDWKKW